MKIIKKIFLMIWCLSLMFSLVSCAGESNKEQTFSQQSDSGKTLEERTIYVHYLREDNQYEGWNLWTWVDGEEGKAYEFIPSSNGEGVVATVVVPMETQNVGYIVRLNKWEAKDVEDDQFIDLSKVTEESYDVYIFGGQEGYNEKGYLKLEMSAEEMIHALNIDDSNKQELMKANELGFLTDTMCAKLDSVVSKADMSYMSECFIKMNNSALLNSWKEEDVPNYTDDDRIFREYAACWLYKLASVCDIGTTNTPWGYAECYFTHDFFWKTCYFDEAELQENKGFNIYWDAFLFALGRCSNQTGMSIMEPDENGYLRYEDDFTYLEAACAFVRLYESIEPNNENQCSIAPETIALANNLPEATYNELPKWYGTTLSNKFGGEEERYNFNEQDIVDLASFGFNFVRVPITYTTIFLTEDNTTDLCEANLINMDALIGWCIENGIHVCLDIHGTPGHMTGSDNRYLGQDTESQEKFLLLWETIANRYAEIPSNALSFNLLNEPAGFTDDEYSNLMKQAIEVIHECSPKRLIFVDMIEYGRELPKGLVDEEVAFSIHFYEAGGFSDSAAYEPGAEDWAYWPLERDGMCYDADYLLDYFATYAKMAEEYDIEIMLQEFGVFYSVDYASTLAYVDELLTALDTYGISWANWTYMGNFGITIFYGRYPRAGAVYDDLGNHRAVATELLEVLQKHMPEKEEKS